MELLDWANRVGAYVVEDDYDSDFRFDGPPLTALAGMDSSASVIYLGTFSKSIGAGLRDRLSRRASGTRGDRDRGQSHPQCRSKLARSGGARRFYFQRFIRAPSQSMCEWCIALAELPAEYALREHFGKVNVSGHQGGMHVMWHLPDSLPNAAVIQATALNHGVGVYSLRSAVAFDFTPDAL